jgi:Ca-activated chloride channel family protein
MRAILIVCGAFALCVLPLAAQDPVFRGGARTVPVYATVRDASGRLVIGLTRNDFQIVDDGKPAEITTFSSDSLPASISLMLDMSVSMLGEHVRVRDSGLQFVDALHADDRVRIGTFGDEIAISPWITSDKAVLSRILREEVWPGGETPLWSAMRAGMQSLAEEKNRRVVVVLSDGIDTGCPRMIGADAAPARPVPAQRTLRVQLTLPQLTGERTLTSSDQATRCATLPDVQRLALEGEFMVYAIGMEGPGMTPGLIRMADDTGGGRFELRRNADLATAFTAVLDELHHQYALGFTPVALDGRTHALEVRVARQGLTARARKNYLAVDR